MGTRGQWCSKLLAKLTRRWRSSSFRRKIRRFSVGILRTCPAALCGAEKTRYSKAFQVRRYAFAVGFVMTCFLVVRVVMIVSLHYHKLQDASPRYLRGDS